VRDSLALVDLYFTTAGDLWVNKTNWLVPGRPISSWFGIKTNTAGCVESIVLVSNRINGPFPPKLVDLKSLKIINFNNNNISGNIDGGLSTLSELEELNLSNNKINGLILPTLGNLKKLKKLLLSLNNISGNLAPQLSGMTSLQVFHANQNKINGPIPKEIGDLANLEELLLSQNNMSGTIPAEIGKLGKLKTFQISQNNFTSLPTTIGDLAQLRTLYADENQITGTLPKELGKLQNLQDLWLNRNQLSGVIPAEFSNFSKLQRLLLNDNQLTGQIPEFIGNLPELISLHLSQNQLTGEIPLSIVNLSKLISLQLNENLLTGEIPRQIGLLKALSSLNISNNKLTGEIPFSIGLIPGLKRIYMHNNNLEGCFPKQMKSFCKFMEQSNANVDGYNFRSNAKLFFDGDFTKWCKGEGVAIATASANSPLCEGSDLKLSASGGIAFSWTGPKSFTANTQNPEIKAVTTDNYGIYTIALENENKCRDTTTVTVIPTLTVTVSANVDGCIGNDITLSAAGGQTYSWTGPNGFVSAVSMPVITNLTTSKSGDYTVTIQTSDCSVTKIVKVSVRIATNASVTSNSPVCVGDTLRLGFIGANQAVWTGPNGFTSTILNPIITQVTTASTGNYSIQAVDDANCRYELTTTVTISPKEVLTIESFPSVCADEDLELPTIVDGKNGTWSGSGVIDTLDKQVFYSLGNIGMQVFTFTPAGNNKCISEINASIFVNTLSLALDNTTDSFDDSDSNGSANVKTSGNTALAKYQLTGSTTLSGEVTLGNDIAKSNLSSGSYLLTLTDQNGCIDTLSFDIKYQKPFFFLPNVVSKNSTSGNNSFYLKGQNIPNYEIQVFNRWGGIEFDQKSLILNDADSGWQPLLTRSEPGVYVYVIKFKTILGEKVLSGSITVL